MHIHLEGQSHLAQVVFAGGRVRASLGRGEHREQQGSEHTGDCDHHKQLDEGEAFQNAVSCLHNGLDTPHGHGSRRRRTEKFSGGGPLSHKCKQDAPSAIRWSDLVIRTVREPLLLPAFPRLARQREGSSGSQVLVDTVWMKLALDGTRCRSRVAEPIRPELPRRRRKRFDASLLVW